MADTNENPHLQKIKNNAVYPGNLKISDSRPVKTPFATNSGKKVQSPSQPSGGSPSRGATKAKEVLNNVANKAKSLLQIEKSGKMLFFFLLFWFIIMYISKKLAKNSYNCTEIQKNRFIGKNDVNSFYSINDSINNSYFNDTLTINGSPIKYEYKLKDFYIKTAYNAFCSGEFRNDYVNQCALNNCASFGVRAIDMQLFSVDTVPTIASSSMNVNTFKESYNGISFKDGLSMINQSFFTNNDFEQGGTETVKNNLKEDPLFLILRLHYGNDPQSNLIETNTTITTNKTTFYNKIYTALTNQFDVSKFASTQLKIIYGTDYDREINTPNIPMSSTKNTIFVFVIINEPNYDIMKQSKLDSIVDLYGDNFIHYRINESSDSNNSFNINQYNSQNALMYSMPAWGASNSNYDFTTPMKNGTQFIGMNFQNYDTYLDYYNGIFISQYGPSTNTITSPYIKKPAGMISLPISVTVS